MNKVIIKGTVTWADGQWFTVNIKDNKKKKGIDVHCYLSNFTAIFEDDLVLVEGHLVATDIGANIFYVDEITILNRAK